MVEKKYYLIKFLLISLVLGLFAAMGAVGVLFYISTTLPDVEKLKNFSPSLPSTIYSQDGEVLRELGREKREMVAVEDIPKIIIDSFLAAEDANFYQHEGIDYLGILRALLADIKAGKIVQGGSTITQQVAKSLLLTREKSIIRKLKDILLAKEIEERFTKDEILFLYLNYVYLGGGYYGVKAAYEGYFGKNLTEATWEESALLAGLLVAPGKISPYINPDWAKRRQRYVLKRIYQLGKLSEEEYRTAVAKPISFRMRRARELKAGHYTELIRQMVTKRIGSEELLNGGYQVYTGLNWEVQQWAEKEVQKGVKAIDKRQGYAGPIKRLQGKEEIHEYLSEKRKSLFSENSQYFLLNQHGEKVYELQFDAEVFDQILQQYNLRDQELASLGIVAGNGEDPAYQMLEKGQNYEAVVIKVNDKQRLAYVNLGGLRGIIPQEGFKWAHRRQVDVNKKYFSEVQYPSHVFKKGDVVNVKLLEKKTKLLNHIDSNSKKNLMGKSSESELIKIAKEQNYLLFSLDQEPQVEGALMALNAQTGAVLAMVGGRDFTKSQFNRAIQAVRQPGSAFKPFLYAVALENKYTPATLIYDSPQALGGMDDYISWKPRNYDGIFKGAMTFRRALEQSRNVPTIKIAQDVGIENIINFSKRIGLKAAMPNDLSVSLGSFGVTLLDLVAAYSIFPNAGKKVRPFFIDSIVDSKGDKLVQEEESIYEQNNKSSAPSPNSEQQVSEEGQEGEINPYLANLGPGQVYDERLAYIMSNILKGVVQNGTGRKAKRIGHFIAGKTGTTNDYIDAWFLGFSSKIIIGVWTGHDNNTTMGWGETGSKAALPIWMGVMSKVLDKYGETDFRVPTGIVNVLINQENGNVARNDDRNIILESFVEGTEPGSSKEIKKEILNYKGIVDEEDDYYENL